MRESQEEIAGGNREKKIAGAKGSLEKITGEKCEGMERGNREIMGGNRGREALEESQEESREGSAEEKPKKEVLEKNAGGNRRRKTESLEKLRERSVGGNRWRESQEGGAGQIFGRESLEEIPGRKSRQENARGNCRK